MIDLQQGTVFLQCAESANFVTSQYRICLAVFGRISSISLKQTIRSIHVIYHEEHLVPVLGAIGRDIYGITLYIVFLFRGALVSQRLCYFLGLGNRQRVISRCYDRSTTFRGDKLNLIPTIETIRRTMSYHIHTNLVVHILSRCCYGEAHFSFGDSCVNFGRICEGCIICN